MQNEKIQKLEAIIEASEKQIQLKENFERLVNTEEYKKVFEEAFFQDYAQKLVILLSEPAMQDKQNQEDIINDIRMVGRLHYFLNSIKITGESAKQDIIDCRQEIEYIRTSEGEE